MKSFSKIYPRDAQEQLEPWTPIELDVKSTTHLDNVGHEQILAILHGEERSIRNKGRSAPSALQAPESGLAVITWQVSDMVLQAPPKSIRDWSFSESFDDLAEEPQAAVEEHRHDPEKDIATILEQAHAQAEEILRESQSAADKVISAAQAESELKKKEGYELGLNDARAEIGEAVKAAHAVVHEIRQWQATFMAEAEQTLVTMLNEIARTMFGEGVSLDANALQVNLNRIMENAQGLGDLNIFLNPRDAKLLDSSWSEYQFLVSGNRVRIIPSDKITPGGCIVKGSMGRVDARVETQLAAVIGTLEELSESRS